ncbi:MAG: hypothetical protein JWO30_944 [Fibrobacteres bacterium]|nr:hypothetical protein [Fibrobacterota bacterium]
MRSLLKKCSLLLLALAALAAIWSCNNTATDSDQYLTWDLTDAYKSYDTVSIKLVDVKDPSLVYEVVWNAGIPDPGNFPKYKLTAAKDKDFIIQIRCYNAKHELLLSKDIEVDGAKTTAPVILMTDVRLLGLTATPGSLDPAFNPNKSSYAVQVGDSVASITLTATPIDVGNVLTIDQKLCAWGLGNTLNLDSGANVFGLTVATKDGKLSKNYEVVVTRGRIIPPEEVVSVTLRDKSLTLFTGDGHTAQKATVVPAGALMQWSSQDENVVRVDGKGNLTPVGPGTARVTVTAGTHTDAADITVKKDPPVLNPGPNQGVKIGGEATFHVSLTQEHGTIVSFKYSLDGDTAWDNLSDTTTAPASIILKHVYPTAGFFTAYFYAKDSEGNIATASCTIHVSDAAILVNILSPGKDTLVNSTPITLKYEVNGNLHSESRDLTEGTNVVSVDSGDGASVKVTLDTKPPTAPNVTSTTPTPTANPKPTWTWTPGGGGDGTFRARLDSADLSASPSITVKTYTSGTNLSAGDHILYVQERDSAGNWSASGSFLVTIQGADITPPNAPNVTSTTPTNNTKPTWTWTSNGGGNGTFRTRLDATDLSAAPSVTVTTYTPATALGAGDHFLYVQERDSVGNWSASGSFKVTILAADVTPPNPPIVTGTSPTNTAPKWSWSTGGGGGSGTFRYKLDDSTLAGVSDTKEVAYTLVAAPVSGTTYKLYVAEKDSAGNWSAPAMRAIYYDLSKPSVAILTPQTSGTYLTRNATVALSGTASGPNTIVKVSYKINNAATADAVLSAGNWSIASVATVEGTATIVTVVATDNLNNTGEATLTVIKDNTPPTAPSITAFPATPTNAAKGSWAWNAGSDGASGSGLNGSYRYSLDGGATWTVITAALVNNLTLAEGDNTFSLQEQDLAGNWSVSATNVVKADRIAPAIAVTSPASPASLSTNHVTLSGTVSDAGAGVLSVTVSGQVSGNGTATVTGNTWTTGDLVLKSGANALVATATDKATNTNTASLSATVTVAVPVVVITYPANNALTNKDTITVKYTVDGGAETSKLFSALTEGNNTLTITSPANSVGVTGSASVTVLKDATAPNFPTVTIVKTPTNTTPGWNWGLGSDNAGGSGVASVWEYQLTGATSTTGTLATNSFSLSGAGEGTYNFTVRQLDKAGNRSAYSAVATIVVDKTPPSVTLNSPTNGLVTSATSVTLSCTIDGTTTTSSPTLSPGANPFSCSKTDSANNTTTKTSTVYYVAKTLFVKTAPTGTGDGMSWTNAMGSIQGALAKAASGWQIWVAAGHYSTDVANSGILVPSNVSFYGGFPVAGTAKSISDRTFVANDTTYIQDGSNYHKIFEITGTEASPLQNITIDGFQFSLDYSTSAISMNYAKAITLKNLVFHPVAQNSGAGITGYLADFTCDNALWTGFNNEYNLINSSGSTMSLSNSTFVGNSVFSEGGPPHFVILDYSTKATLNNNKFLDAPTNGGMTLWWRPFGTTGELDIIGCSFKGGTHAYDMIQNYDLNVVYTGNNIFTP